MRAAQAKPVTIAQPPKSCERRRASYRNYREVTVGGLRTACVSRAQLAQLMVGDCLAARGGKRAPKLVFASNGHAIAMASTDCAFRRQFEAATLIHADGQPVVFASKTMTRSPIPERSARTAVSAPARADKAIPGQLAASSAARGDIAR